MGATPPASSTPLAGRVARSSAARETPENRRQLIDMARENMAHSRAGNRPSQEPDVLRVPVENYLDPVRWAAEVALFKRLPLMLALGGELRGASSYKAMTVMDVPVLLTRDADGDVHAFVNQCSHRGAVVVGDGLGTARRFACPYHNWTYDTRGCLVGVTDREFFGNIDTARMGLTPLPVAERAGLVFVVLTPGAAIDIDAHLCGYGKVLDFFGFGDWYLVSRKELVGPNWKIAYDGYLDFYHLPFLHRNSFGPDVSNKAIYRAWGPHQRVTSPDPSLLELDAVPEDEWNLDRVCDGVWTLFPHVSFAGNNTAGLVSQRPPPAPIHRLSATEPWTNAPELGMLAKVFDQDTFNMAKVQLGLETTWKPGITLGNYQEAKIRWLHQLLGQWVDG